MSLFSGKVAVVTGAGSGIGRALALGLAARGAKLALSDINEATLAETTALVGAGAEVDARWLDVSDAASFAVYAAAVSNRFGIVHQLYNNAGVARGSRLFLEMRCQDFDAILRINFGGVVNGSRAFLPHLIASGAGCLVNISSLNGLMAQGALSAYVASKFAVRGFTEAIRVEMLMAGHPVQVVVVHPGGVRTNIANAAFNDDVEISEEERKRAQRRIRMYNEKFLTMAPEEAARQILDGVQRGRSRIVITSRAIWLDRLIRLRPESYPRRVAAMQKKAPSELQTNVTSQE
jgi:NAD(P)-dependent dehydrogenase (short-subunit alcohol dehydrogenase family)